MQLNELKNKSPILYKKITNQNRTVSFDEIKLQLLIDLEETIIANTDQYLTSIAHTIKHIISQAMVYNLQVIIKELDHQKQMLNKSKNKDINNAANSIIKPILPIIEESDTVFNDKKWHYCLNKMQ